jgi:hypothetical protein
MTLDKCLTLKPIIKTMNVPFIDKNEFIYISNVLNKPYEVCGALRKGVTSNGIHKFDFATIKKGPIITDEECKQGALCIHDNSTYIFHTHPNICKAYPSIQDLERVLKYRHITKNSIIMTVWGVFQIYSLNSNKSVGTYKHHELINDLLTDLNSKTKTPNHSSLSWSKVDQYYVFQMVRKLSKLLSFDDVGLHFDAVDNIGASDEQDRVIIYH